ncbi:hypothetical protein ACM6N5_17555 [Rossellomorea marisflavi]|uniref:hypothetical protein n=1 Tax=Rossellomorea marisflavi TaxID=189381 RepID=UPI003AD9AD33
MGPVQRSRSGSTDSPRKAAGRSETERSLYHHSPLQHEEIDMCGYSKHPSIIEQCSAAKDGRLLRE